MSALDDEPISEVQLEIAFLSCLTRNRPIGTYKHIVILRLQNEIYQRTRVWLELGNLWSRLGEMYDLQGIEALNRNQRSPPPGYKSDPALDLPLSTPKPPLSPPLPVSPHTSLSPILPGNDTEKYQYQNNHTDKATVYNPSISTPTTLGFSPSGKSTPYLENLSASEGNISCIVSPIEGDDKAIRGRPESTVSTAASGSAGSARGMMRAASASGASSGGSGTSVISVGSSSQTIQSHSPSKEGGKGQGTRAGTGGARGGGNSKRWVSGRNGVHKAVIAGVVVNAGQKRGEKRSGGAIGEVREGNSLIVSVPKEKKRKIT